MQQLLIADGESGDVHIVAVAPGMDLHAAAQAYASENSFNLPRCHWQYVHTLHLGTVG